MCSTCSVCSLMSAPLYFGRHQVNQRENEHPDQIDEVPVETGHFDILGLKLAAHDRLADDAEIDQTDDDVGHVQSGNREECGAEQRHAPLIAECRDVFVVD